MILLVTPSERAADCAFALHAATDEKVMLAENLVQAITLLRAECYLAVVFDQYLLETEPHEVVTTFSHLDTAIPLQMNLGISGIDRVVYDVRAAIQRRRREESSAREAAIARLHSELNGTITALLLSSELALETPDMPPAAVEKLQSIHDSVKKFRNQLEITIAKEEAEAVGRS